MSTDNAKTPEAKMAVARLRASRLAPYYTTAIQCLVPYKVAGRGLNTLGVTQDGLLLWDPEAVERWSSEELAAVLIHEVSHLLRKHHPRHLTVASSVHERPEDIAEAWNLCGDAEINDDLAAMGAKLPGHAIYPKTLGQDDGKLAEEYYRGLVKQAQKNAKDGKSPKDGKGIYVGCGSGAGGKPLPGEEDAPGKGGDKDGDGRPAGRSEVEMERVRRQTAEAVQAHERKLGRGSVPAGISVWAGDVIKPPKVPWQAKLARAARGALANKAGMVDYKYGRPSRRQAGMGYGPGKPVLPILRAPIPEVAVAIDTSGSMGVNELARALSEASGILKAVGARVSFMACDADVHLTKDVSSPSQLAKLLKGGGGTDFRPVFENLRRLRRRPDVLVFITDGDGPAPEAPPMGIKVIWVLVGAHHRKPCAWGEHVEVDDAA